nr:PREDICTED: uncharacterized protein LOC108223826 [Daucus carota subsp. sativus]
MKSKSGHANKNGPLITIIKIDKALYLLPVRTILVLKAAISRSMIFSALAVLRQSGKFQRRLLRPLLYHVGANSSEIDKALYLLPVRTILVLKAAISRSMIFSALAVLRQSGKFQRRLLRPLLYHVGANSSEVMCDTYTPAHEPILANKRCNAAKILSHPDLQLKFLGSVLNKNTPY